MRSVLAISAVVMMINAGKPAPTTVAIRSAKPGQEVHFRAYGKGWAPKLSEGVTHALADTVWAKTPAIVAFDMVSAQLTVVSTVESALVEVHVDAGRLGVFSISAAGVLITQDADGVQVSGRRR